MPRDAASRPRADAAVNDVDGLDVWERQPEESGPAWEAFATYRDMAPGERTVRKVARTLNKSVTLIAGWSSGNDWTARAAAWDREQDRQKREADMEAVLAMSRRQATQAAALQGALMEPATAFLRRIQEIRASGQDPFAGFDLRELQKMVEAASRAFAQVATFERLARGLSTTNVGGSDGGAIQVDVARQEVEGWSRERVESYLLGAADAEQAFSEHGPA